VSKPLISNRGWYKIERQHEPWCRWLRFDLWRFSLALGAGRPFALEAGLVSKKQGWMLKVGLGFVGSYLWFLKESVEDRTKVTRDEVQKAAMALMVYSKQLNGNVLYSTRNDENRPTGVVFAYGNPEDTETVCIVFDRLDDLMPEWEEPEEQVVSDGDTSIKMTPDGRIKSVKRTTLLRD